MKKPEKTSALLRLVGATLILLSFVFVRQRDSSDDVSSFVEARPCEGRVERERFDLSEARSLTLETPVQSNHSSSIAETPDGDLSILWYGGTREGAKDVCIYEERRAGDRMRALRSCARPIAIDSKGRKSRRLFAGQASVDVCGKRFLRRMVGIGDKLSIFRRRRQKLVEVSAVANEPFFQYVRADQNALRF